MKAMIRCPWPTDDPLMIHYHDKEWGVPVHDDWKMFEYIVLDAFQAGLSWKTILHKRENFRKAYDNFDFAVISGYDNKKLSRLLKDPGIIRNRLKIEASVHNARIAMDIAGKHGSLSAFIWSLAGGKPIINHWTSLSQLPASSLLSDYLSKTLKKEGFSFVGTTICYSFMQAAGLVNDHLVDCYRFDEINRMYRSKNA